MSLSTNLISGLSSGFDWRSMIDELMAIEHRRVDLVEDKKLEYELKRSTLQSINTKLLAFRTQAGTLSSSNAFNVYTSSLTTDSTTYSASDFLTVSTTTSAAPGTHEIEMVTDVSTVAEARKISSRSFTSHDTALNSLDSNFEGGEFIINGRAVKVEATDDLLDIRDKINNLNMGTNATGVTASVLAVSSSNYRMVLTSDNTGEDAFTIFDASSDTQNILSSGLGFTEGTTSVKNYISNGVQSEAFSSSSQSVSSMLGITIAQTGTTVSIGSVDNITIDLSKSLTEIASDINTAVIATNITASVVSTTENNVTTYRLKIENTTGFTDHKHVLETLGILKGDQGNVQEVHQGSSVLYGDDNQLLDPDNKALNSILMTDLRIAVATSAGVAVNDDIRVIGTKGDGTSVDYTFTVEVASTVQDFVDWVDTKFTGGGDPANNVTVTFDEGLIKITDDNAGDSQLSIAIIANNDDGGKLDFGAVSATTEGYTMEVQSGQDANIIINGTTITSSSNIIDDVIEGVTLNLKAMEWGKTVTLTIGRDNDTIKSNVQGLLDKYNDVITDINEQSYYDEETETTGILQGDSTLSSIRSSLQNIVINTITGLPTTMNALSLIGINSKIDYSDPKNNGMLYIDNDDFMDALEDNFQALRRIFVAEGTTTDGDVEYVYHSNDTVAGTYDIDITQVATQASVVGNEDLSDTLAANETLTITDTVTGRVAEISLSIGDTLTEIVNAINSELSDEDTEVHVSNTAIEASGSAVTYLTKWSEIDGATVNDGDTITVSGTKRSGASVQDTYTIEYADDTLQGFLSFIENLYGNEVSAYFDTSGNLTLQDNEVGDSALSITITENNEGDGSNLDLGTLSTTGGTEGRYALDITASASGNYLQISHDEYGSSNGFTISQDLRGTEFNQIIYTDTANTTDASDGDIYITSSTTWDDIYGAGTIETDDTITISGTDRNGGALNTGTPDDLIYTIDVTKDIGDLLSRIVSVFGDDVDASTTVVARIEQGKIIVEQTSPTGDSSISLTLTYEDVGGSGTGTLDLGTIDQSTERDLDLGLVNGAHGGLDVQGTINSESATGAGQVLTGDAPGTGETTSVERLVIRYTGTGTGDQGDVKITMGVAELFDRILDDITNIADGYLDYRIESMGNRIDDFEDQIEDMEARLNRRMETMINRFVAMELALARIQNQSDWLSAQIGASFSGWGSL